MNLLCAGVGPDPGGGGNGLDARPCAVAEGSCHAGHGQLEWTDGEGVVHASGLRLALDVALTEGEARVRGTKAKSSNRWRLCMKFFEWVPGVLELIEACHGKWGNAAAVAPTPDSDAWSARAAAAADLSASMLVDLVLQLLAHAGVAAEMDPSDICGGAGARPAWWAQYSALVDACSDA